MINLELEGSTALRAASKDFRYGAHILSTSRDDMAIGDWAKSSMIL